MDSSSITELNISCYSLTELPDFRDCVNLKTLDCTFNQITILETLPKTQDDYPGLKCLSALCLPHNLNKLDCSRNRIKYLDNLPPNLEILCCIFNQLTGLENLPLNLKVLNCSHN